MSPLLFSIQIPRRNSCCSKCEERFLAGKDYFSLLRENLIGGDDERLDFCPACFAQDKEQLLASSKESSLKQWKSKVPLKENLLRDEKLSRLKKEEAKILDLFLTLQQEIAEKKVEDELFQEIFILSLYLSRKKIMVSRTEKKENGETLEIFEILETEELVTVKKLKLPQLEIGEIQQRIAKKLQTFPKKKLV